MAFIIGSIGSVIVGAVMCLILYVVVLDRRRSDEKSLEIELIDVDSILVDSDEVLLFDPH